MIVWDGCDSSFVEKVRRVEFEMPELAAECPISEFFHFNFS